MELTPHLEAIRGDLESLVASDEALAAALERMARPIEATLQLRLLDVLGDAALELTEQIPPATQNFACPAGMPGSSSSEHRRRAPSRPRPTTTTAAWPASPFACRTR
jgi:hypothetical protein